MSKTKRICYCNILRTVYLIHIYAISKPLYTSVIKLRAYTPDFIIQKEVYFPFISNFFILYDDVFFVFPNRIDLFADS